MFEKSIKQIILLTINSKTCIIKEKTHGDILMNTLQNLMDNGIEPYTAQDMLDGYFKRIGTMSGVYEITDITYDFNEKGRDVTLKCSLCGKEIHRMMISGRNKWSELIKSCPCQKELKERQKKTDFEISKKLKKQEIYDDALSMVGLEYGDYKIIDFKFIDEAPMFKLKCKECGNIITAHYQGIKNKAKKYEKCHKHFNPIKYDESYIGRKKNFLTVKSITRLPNKHRAFVCECDCGNIAIIEPTIWEQELVKSCGCKHDELSRKSNETHGLSGTRLYGIWKGMNNRCFNPNSQSYSNYGGRGITVCTEWQGEQGLLNFVNWSERNGYQDNLTIDRIDVNGNYEPSNCRWADWVTQNNNRRPKEEWKEREKSIEFEGQKYFLYELCEMFDTSEPAVRYRMTNLGMTFEQALKTPKLTDGRPRKTN